VKFVLKIIEQKLRVELNMRNKESCHNFMQIKTFNGSVGERAGPGLFGDDSSLTVIISKFPHPIPILPFHANPKSQTPININNFKIYSTTNTTTPSFLIPLDKGVPHVHCI